MPGAVDVDVVGRVAPTTSLDEHVCDGTARCVQSEDLSGRPTTRDSARPGDQHGTHGPAVRRVYAVSQADHAACEALEKTLSHAACDLSAGQADLVQLTDQGAVVLLSHQAYGRSVR